MTTNVYDHPAKVMASDSRWSITSGKWVVYVDDVQFNKIEIFGKEAGFIFAGLGSVIQQWKNWIRSAPSDASLMPSCDGISVCVVQIATGDVKFADKQEIVRDGGYFAGSGARHAFLCWTQNRDARRCVDSAKQVDVYSGGEVKFFQCRDGVNNLCAPTVEVTIDMVNQAVQTRGEVMEIAKLGGAPFKLADVAANDRELHELQAKIANGELSVEAPCDEMYNHWTDDETSKLRGVLGGVFGWKS